MIADLNSNLFYLKLPNRDVSDIDLNAFPNLKREIMLVKKMYKDKNIDVDIKLVAYYFGFFLDFEKEKFSLMLDNIFLQTILKFVFNHSPFFPNLSLYFNYLPRYEVIDKKTGEEYSKERITRL